MPVKEIERRASAAEAGRTVATLLKEEAVVSHAEAKGLLAGGMVKVNGHLVRDPARRLKEGDLLQARYDPAHGHRRQVAPGRKEGHGFRVLLEDRYLLVVEKDPGILTVPAPGHTAGTLADRLVEREAERGARLPGLYVIHRIDRFTSGLVLFARSEEAAGPLIEQFTKRTAEREYLAICTGLPSPPQRRLESWLTEEEATRKMRETKRQPAGRAKGDKRDRAQKAITHFRVEEPLTNAALLRVKLETGRRNQIRVQLAGIGHALLGDSTYGVKSPLIDRVALHATRLGFKHPITGLEVRVESPLPDDMRKLLRRLRR